MGRSVSYAPGSVWVMYGRLLQEDSTAYVCHRCGQPHYGEDEPEECPDCGSTGFYTVELDNSLDLWDDFVTELRTTLRRAFPSLEEVDEWLGREDLALLANRLVYIGVSEYCGLVSLWCVPVDDSPLVERWARAIETKVQTLWDGMATVRSLDLMGRFGTGEAVFHARA